MRLSLSVVDGTTQAQHDVLVDALPESAVAELLPALLRAVGADLHPSFARQSAVWVDGRRVAPDETLRAAGLVPGSVVVLHEPDGRTPELPRGVVELRVVSGPGSGRVHRLGIGDFELGNGAAGMSLPDVLLPVDAVRLRVTTNAEIEIVSVAPDLRSGLRVDGHDPDVPHPAQDLDRGDGDTGSDEDPDSLIASLPDAALTRAERRRKRRRGKQAARRTATDAPVDPEPPTWPAGADLRVGGTVLQWHPVWEPDADVSPSEDLLGTDFNRPPRLIPPARESAFVIPGEPRAPRRATLPWPMVLAPLVMAGPMAVVFGSYRFLMFAALSPVMALFNFVAQRRGAARDYREQLLGYRQELASVLRRIAVAERLERDELRRDRPDPAAVLLAAAGPGQQLWMRRRTDADALTLRVGVADVPSAVRVSDRSRKETDEAREPDVLGDVPVAISLRDVPVVGVCGDEVEVDALARWFVGQAAVLHTPKDLRVVVLTGSDREQQWGWTRWLPHCRVEGEPVAAVLGTDQGSVGRRLAELVHLVESRRGDGAPGSVTGTRLPPAPDTLVVLDGARRLRSLPGVVTLLREGASAGVYVVCLDEDERSLPEECAAVLEAAGGTVELRRTGSESVARIRPDLVESAWAERVGRALAPLRDTTPDARSSALPASARLLSLLDLEDPTPDTVARRWGPEARTDVVLGAGFDGPFHLDLRRDGPHALVAGTTGSGKSELLQTLVASLAIANSPEQLTFVLVDYKGGSAFKDCARLPHTVGMVTDLDTHLVGRALVSLGAELRRREHLLAGPGAKDLEDYWALRRRDPDLPAIPRLVIVIDEFASLKAELPDFVTGLVTVAQRGRSLGIHLVLATQRPSGVISNDIRANTNLRIALRVTDEVESRDVIDAPDSATIAADQPGRGYARLGHSSLLPFQAGRVGGARPQRHSSTPVRDDPVAWTVPWTQVGHPAPARTGGTGPTTDEGDTDLSVLVEAITGANEMRRLAPQHSPWLPELPRTVLVGDLPPADEVVEADGSDGVTGWSTAWAVEDHPEDQTQVARRFTLGADGHLYVVGGPRSGRSTALRTIAAGLAQAAGSRDLHLYGLDCGNGALLPLIALPHTGAVVQRTEVERAGRLLDRLAEEVKARQEVLGRSGYADVDEQRRAAAPDDRLPYVVLLVDRWEGFVSDLGEVDTGRLTDQVLTLLREGASAGVQLVVTGDRSLLSGRISTVVEHKLVLRLPDRGDYATAGLRPKDLPDEVPDGRGFWADSGTEARVAVLGTDTAGAAQSELLRELGRRLAEAERGLAPAPAHLRPVGLAQLPSTIAADEVLGQAPPYAPTMVPLAVGGDRLELLVVEATATPALVVGQPRTGRTSTLCFAAAHAIRTGRPVLAFTPVANALTRLVGTAAVLGTDASPEEVVGRLRDLPDGALVLVDDAELLRDGPLAPVLTAVIRQGRERGFAMVVAGGVSELSGGFSGWVVEARKGRKGLLLSPQESLQADVFGARVSRTSLVSRVTPGRGVLFAGDGGQVGVQVPLVD